MEGLIKNKITIVKPVSYDMVVRCKIDDNEENFYFDYVEDSTTNLSSDICTHPLVTGDVIADHMYINPSTVSFSGTFSLSGNKKGNKEYDFGSLDRLSNIQEIFERIMKEGIMCTLIKIGSNGDESRFKLRKNMVLTNITWIEHQLSMDFSFTFNEALTAIVQKQEDYEEDVLDESLPVTSDPLSLNVTDELLNESDIIQYVISILQENGLFADNFLEDAINNAVAAANWSSERLKGAAAGAAVGAVGGTVAAAVAIHVMVIIYGCGHIPGPGWIAAAVILAVAIVGGIVYGIIKTWKNSKYKIKRFKYYKDESKREKERERFYEFIGQIYLQVEQLNERMSLYGFAQNISQQCFVNIDNDQYIFTFTKSTNDSNYSLDVVNIDDSNIANITNISEKAITNLGECNSDVILFTTSSGCQVYLANREVYAKRQSGASNEEIEELQKDLTKYAILSSTMSLTKLKDKIIEIIKSQIFK